MGDIGYSPKDEWHSLLENHENDNDICNGQKQTAFGTTIKGNMPESHFLGQKMHVNKDRHCAYLKARSAMNLTHFEEKREKKERKKKGEGARTIRHSKK